MPRDWKAGPFDYHLLRAVRQEMNDFLRDSLGEVLSPSEGLELAEHILRLLQDVGVLKPPEDLSNLS